MRWSVVLLLLSAPALAAGPAGGGAPGSHRWASPLGYSILVPPGYDMDVQTAPEDAAPDQALEGVTLLRGGDALVDVDVFDNFDKIGVSAWFQREMAFLRTPDSAVRSLTVTARRLPAVRIEQPRSPQAPPRTIVLVRSGRLLVRITCQDASDPMALAAFESVAGSFASAETP